jgi:hypothetical protein
VDFPYAGWKMPERKDVITPAKGTTHDVGPERITGRTFGTDKGPLQVSIYDKTREIKKHRKEWMREVWAREEAYDESLAVARVEFRFRRELMRQFRCPDPVTGEVRSINTIADLRSSEGDLICYVVGGDGTRPWFRVASPDTRQRRSDRREAAVWWKEISRVFLEDLPKTGRIRQRRASSRRDLRRTRRTFIAYAIKAAAQAAIHEPHPAGTAEDFLGPVAREWLDDSLEARDLGSWDEAVASEVKRSRISGRSPFS